MKDKKRTTPIVLGHNSKKVQQGLLFEQKLIGAELSGSDISEEKSLHPTTSKRSKQSVTPSTKHTKDGLDNQTLPKSKIAEAKSASTLVRVRASDFVIKKNKIRYHEYSCKAEGAYPVNIWALLLVDRVIDHEFLIRLDSISKPQIGRSKFSFLPSKDKTLLLEAINRVIALCGPTITAPFPFIDPSTLKTTYVDWEVPLVVKRPIQTTKSITDSTTVKFPQNGRFNLPWEYVIFSDAVMYLQHPATSQHGTIWAFRLRHPDIARSFRDIISHISSRCQEFDVEAKDGVIQQVYNFEAFRELIPTFHERATIGKEEIEITSNFNFSKSTFGKSEFVKQVRKIKSRYIAYLAKNQSENRPIYRMLESRTHEVLNEDDEYGYLFTIKESLREGILIFENETEASRSSLIFQIRLSGFDSAVNTIRRFLSDEQIKNKRQKISYDQVKLKDLSILGMRRMFHKDYDSWRAEINKLINSYSCDIY